MPMTGAVTSSMALTVASLGLIPCSRWWMTASTTTMASSTTMPMASTRPNIDSVLTEKPSTGKKMNVPMRETGIVSSGMIVARMFCRKMKTTSVTRISASTKVFRISWIEACDRRRGVVDDLVVHPGREQRLRPCPSSRRSSPRP